MAEGRGRWIKFIQPAPLGTKPQHPLRILVDIPDRVVAEAGRIARIVPVTGKGVTGPIKFIQPAIGADPQSAVLILINVSDDIVA